MEFLVQVAGKTIKINSVYKLIYYYCWGYRVPYGKPDIIVTVGTHDINHEFQMLNHDAKLNDMHVPQYVFGKIESQIILRKIANAMLDLSTLLMHGTVMSDGQWGYMLTAPSGIGKTTRAKRLVKAVPDMTIINGDKPLIRIDDDEAIVYGTPWCGKEFINENTSVPLRAIFLLERAEHTEIKRITFAEALPVLVKQTYFSSTGDADAKTMALLMQMGKHVQFYRYRSESTIDDVLDAYHAAIRGVDGP